MPLEAEQNPEQETQSEKIAELLYRKFGEEHGFDEETCREIAAMSPEEAFETAYGYLAQAGFDPEAELGAFMETPESQF